MRRLFPFIFLILLSLPAYGNVRLAVDSSSLDFGAIGLTTTKDLTLHVKDTADVDLQIFSIQIAGANAGDFTVIAPSSFPVTLTAHDSIPRSIVVEFAPQLIGQRSAILQLATTDGPIAILLKGTGLRGDSSNISLSKTAIDFGLIAPNGVLYDTVELYSDGPDNATISGIQVSNSSNQIAFEASLVDQTRKFPFILVKGDSVAIAIQFNGLLPLGEKDGKLLIFGGTTGVPLCVLKGVVQWGSFSLQPSAIDFGTMYAGEVKDSTVRLTNNGNVSISVDDIQPLVGDFTLVNRPSTPYILKPGVHQDFIIRANPSLQSSHAGQLQVLSRTAQPSFQQSSFTVTVLPAPISAPDTQTAYYTCAASGTIQVDVPITNTGNSGYTITNINASDTSVLITAGVSLPVVIPANKTVSVLLSLLLPSGDTSGKIILLFYGGDQIVLSDTIFLKQIPSTATVQLSTFVATDTTHVGVSATSLTNLVPFGLHTIIMHLRSANEDIAEIDPATIKLSSDLSNSSISIQPVSGGYDITVTSVTPITVASGDPLVSFETRQFVSKTNSALVTIGIDAPEEVGCLVWKSDSTSVSGFRVCGSDLVQSMLGGKLLIESVSLKDNPVSGSIAQLNIVASQQSDIECDLIDALGETVSTQSIHLASGINEASIPMNRAASGPYYLRLVSSFGEVHSLRILKLQ